MDALERCRNFADMFAELTFVVGTVSFAEAAVVLAEAVHTLCCNSRRLAEIWTQSRLLCRQLQRQEVAVGDAVRQLEASADGPAGREGMPLRAVASLRPLPAPLWEPRVVVAAEIVGGSLRERWRKAVATSCGGTCDGLGTPRLSRPGDMLA